MICQYCALGVRTYHEGPSDCDEAMVAVGCPWILEAFRNGQRLVYGFDSQDKALTKKNELVASGLVEWGLYKA